MRPKVPFDEIENLTFLEKGEDKKIIDYPFNQLVAIRSRLERGLKKKDDEIKKLEESIKEQIQFINREKMGIKGDLKNIKLVIGEKAKDPNSIGFDKKKFTILRGGKYVRAKIRIMGRVRWLHIGSVDKWAKKTDEAILRVAKKKLKDHFTDKERPAQ